MVVPKDAMNLRNQTIVLLDEKVYPVIVLEVIPGFYSDKTLLNFDWTIVDFKSDELVLKVDFEHSNYVSTSNPADQIKVTIYGLNFIDI